MTRESLANYSIVVTKDGKIILILDHLTDFGRRHGGHRTLLGVMLVIVAIVFTVITTIFESASAWTSVTLWAAGFSIIAVALLFVRVQYVLVGLSLVLISVATATLII